jgi:LysM repeat protein
MNNATRRDPTTPTITFDNYVIPETVTEHRSVSAAPFGPIFSNDKKPMTSSMIVSTGLIVFLTFLLGVLTTLHFVKPTEVADADRLIGSGSMAEPGTMVGSADPTETYEMVAASVQFDETPSIPKAPEPAVVNNAAVLERAVTASLQQDVTRQDQADLITPSGAMSRIDPSELSMKEILLGLTPTRGKGSVNDDKAVKGSQTILNRDKLRALREGVLSGAYTVKTVKRNGKERLCLRMPVTSVTQDEAADMIREAAARGEITLPESLSTADGDFDADTLIFNLVQTSLANDGTAEGQAAAKEMSRRAFAASNAKTRKVKGQRVYEVTAGDSLAYLSLQFYGQPSAYLKIFNANRDILKSPDMIQVGQRLKIPG